MVVYAHRQGYLRRLSPEDAINETLGALEFEIFTVAPLVKCGTVHFAAVGAPHMYNTGGAVRGLSYQVQAAAATATATEEEEEEKEEENEERLAEDHAIASVCCIVMNIRAENEILCYSSRSPVECKIDGRVGAFVHDEVENRLTVSLPPYKPNHVFEVELKLPL
eukprot:TRINITY_DN1286_c0_g2_i2.p1 TRINITY_DN1286_c0_g2~~TRINITY_DN1286_c0_g2_i2.p1  ORF type:complete len:191 (+),score=65.91 TRINITY_DN1286_c0_g2_i2:80-574(+)